MNSLIKKIKIKRFVRKLKKGKFKNDDTLKYIEIPEGVESLSSECFKGCNNLETVVLPESLTVIGSHAFEGCESLVNIKIPKNVSDISSYAFCNCKKLEKIILPKSLTVIGSYAFDGCESLVDIKIPKNVRDISFYAFHNCKKLEKVVLPEGIDGISDSLFSECENLTEVEIPKTVCYIGNSAFALCKSLGKLDLPDDIETIGCNAFYGCESLESIVLPSKLNRLEDDSFCHCESLKKIIFLTNKMSYIGIGAFSDCYKLEKLIFPETVDLIRPCAFDNTMLKTIVFPKFSKKIGSTAFTIIDADCYFPYSLIMSMKSSNIINRVGTALNSVTEDSMINRNFGDKQINLKKVFNTFPNLDLRTFTEKEEYLDKLCEFTNYYSSREMKRESICEYRDLPESFKEFERLQKSTNLKALEDEKLEEETLTPIVNDHITENEVKESLRFSIKSFEKRYGYIENSIFDNYFKLSKENSDIVSKIFTYEMLSKNDKTNLSLGFLCDSCMKIYEEGSKIQNLIATNPDVQALVIRDINRNIIAFGILYVNREKGYAAINKIEVSKKYQISEEAIKEIYLKVKQGVRAFANEYNKENSDKPLTKVTCGIANNFELMNENIMMNPQSEILENPAINNLECEKAGGWNGEQRIIWDIEGEKKRRCITKLLKL